jgi:hypothetical protein
MKYFEITPEDYATAIEEDRPVASLIDDAYNADLEDLNKRHELLLAALRDIPFGEYDVDFHSYEPHIKIPWDDRDPVKVLGLDKAIWKFVGEKICWGIEKDEFYFRHHLSGLLLTVQKTPGLPGSTHAIYRNGEGVRYVGRILEVEKEGGND